MSRYQWLVLVVAWLGWVFDVFDTALFNFAKEPMLTQMLGGKDAYKLIGAEREGTIQTFFLVGWAIGGLIFSVAADRYGRTKTLIWTIVLYCAFTALTALCQTWEQVAAIRFLTGIGIGGEWAAGAALIAEVVPNRARAGAASLLQTAAAFGPMLAALANTHITPMGWQKLFLAGLAPAILTIIIRWKVKEPERWENQSNTNATSPFKSLFEDPKARRNALIAMAIGLTGIATAGNLSFWMPNFVKEASVGLSDAVVAVRKSEITYLQHIGTLAGVFFFPALCEWIGRKKAIAGFFVLSLGALWLAASSATSFESLRWKAPLLSFFIIGLTSGFGLYFPELFATRFRATGIGLAYNVARIVQAPIPWLTGLVISANQGQTVVAGLLFTASIYVIGLIAIAFAPETKGKPLPE